MLLIEEISFSTEIGGVFLSIFRSAFAITLSGDLLGSSVASGDMITLFVLFKWYLESLLYILI